MVNLNPKSLGVFTQMAAVDCEAVLSSAVEKRFWRDQVIFFERDPVSHIFLLLSGTVKLTQETIRDDEVILRLISRGDIVGRAFGRDGGQGSTARAVEKSALLVWEVGVFEILLNKFSVFRGNVIRAFEETLIEMEQRFWGVSTQSIESRLSSELLRLAKKVEQRKEKNERRIVLSHSELAQLTGASASTISHVLREWQSQGILAIQRRAVAVHNLDALARLAEHD